MAERAAPVRIRRATVRDLGVLRRHRDAMFRDMGRGNPRSLAAADRAYAVWARRLLRTGDLVGFLAVLRDGTVVAGGCVWLREHQPHPVLAGGRVPYLLSMYTEPAHRRRGLATKIVRAATRWARARGFPRFFLHASEKGRGVYEKLGWSRTWEMETKL